MIHPLMVFALAGLAVSVLTPEKKNDTKPEPKPEPKRKEPENSRDNRKTESTQSPTPKQPESNAATPPIENAGPKPEPKTVA